MSDHNFTACITWTGNKGPGTSGYRDYSRDYDVDIDGKPTLKGSCDPAYRGDASRHNLEDLLVAALSSCHMLWYLHLCAEVGIVVVSYSDHAKAVMNIGRDGAGEFVATILRPEVLISSGNLENARRLHEKAHAMCFIARSVNFPVRCDPSISMV